MDKRRNSPHANSTILIVNEQPLLRDALASLIRDSDDLGMLAVETDNLAEAREALREKRPTLVVCEILIQSELCFEFIESTRKTFTSTRILVFSQQLEVTFAERALRSGADGYISTSAEIQEVQGAIKSVLDGNIYLSKRVEQQIVQRVARARGDTSTADPCAALTNRELHILYQFGNGLPPRAIADQLDLSVKTVETYRERLKEKLGFRTTFELLRFALENQVLGLDTQNSSSS